MKLPIFSNFRALCTSQIKQNFFPLSDPQRAKGYDVRSDVWSLGITLIEISTGKFPYRKWSSVFDQLQQVVHGDPPRLEIKDSVTGRTFTFEFVNFVNTCLIKDETQRPKYVRLLQDPFIQRAESEASAINMAGYVSDVLTRLERMEVVKELSFLLMDDGCRFSLRSQQH